MSAQLRDAADEVMRLEQELTGGLADVFWSGPDADRFRGMWSGEMVPALHQVADAVTQLSQQADLNAAEQDAASGR